MSVNSNITDNTQADGQLFEAVEAALSDSRDSVALLAVSYAAKRSVAKLKRDAYRVQTLNVPIDPTGRATELLERKLVEVNRVRGRFVTIRQRERLSRWQRIMMAASARNIELVADDTAAVLRIVVEHDSRFRQQGRVRAEFNPSPERLQAIAETGARLLREKSVDELAQFSE